MSETKFFIAGVQFRPLEAKESFKGQEVGDELLLEREPDNKYDPNAVKILSGEFHVGYVPKKFSSEVAALMDIDVKLQCEIVTLNLTGKPWEWCEVCVREISND